MESTRIQSNQLNLEINRKYRTHRFTSEVIHTTLTILLITTLILQNSFAQEYLRWNLPEGAKLRIGKGSVDSLRFSSDGNRLIAGSSIGFWIYDALSGDELDLIPANQSNVIGVSPDARLYVEKDIDNTVSVRNLADRNVIATLQGDNSDIYYVRFNLDKKILVSDIGSEIHVWDLNTGEIRTSIDLEADWIFDVAMSPDGTKLASLSRDSDHSSLQLWDVSTGVHITTLTKSARNFRDLMFAPGGNILLSAGDSSIHLWDLSTGKKTTSFSTPSIGRIAISPDSKTVATGGFSGLYLWDLASGTLRTELSGHVYGVGDIAFSPDGRTIASEGYDYLFQWDVESGERKMTIVNHSLPVNSLTFSHDNKTLALGHWYNINLYDAVNGQLKTTFFGSRFTYNTDLDFSRDGKVLASIIWGGISLWEIHSGAPITVVRGYGDGIRGTRSGYSSVAYSPDGSLLAGGNGDATIHLWYRGRTRKGSLIGHTDSVTSIAFNQDGRNLVSGSYDNTVRLWDVVDGSNIATFESHSDVVNCVDISPDARYIASGSKDKSIIIWDVQNGNQKYTLLGHTDEVFSVAFSLDGQTLISGGGREDSTVRIWNVNSGEEITTLTGHTRGNTKVVFAPDGKTFVSGSYDGTAILWDLAAFIDPEDIITYRDEDVNRDGVVTIEDLILVATQFGQSGVGNSADINADGVIDVKDILLVAAELSNENGAPSIYSSKLTLLSTSDVQLWLKNAYQVSSNMSVFKRGIAVLENLLTLLSPDKTVLLPNYPNPFNPETWIPYQLSKDSDVTIHIHSSNGQLIRTLQLGNKMAGLYYKPNRAAHWDGNNELGEPIASGIYYYTITVGNVTDTRRMVIRK